MKKYAITGGVCAAFAALYCALGDFSSMPLPEKYRTLCDAFTVPGVLCLCLGALLWAGKKGAFSGIGYCLRVAGNALLPGHREQETYYDYVRRRRQKPHTAYAYLSVTGTANLILAIAFLLLYN